MAIISVTRFFFAKAHLSDIELKKCSDQKMCQK